MAQKDPNKVDGHVGARVRLRRVILGLSQEKLGESIGVTFQQVQKYEKGLNRIGAGRLMKIAEVLGVPVSFFYEGANAALELKDSVEQASYVAEFGLGDTMDEEVKSLIAAFRTIKSVEARRSLVSLANALAAQNS